MESQSAAQRSPGMRSDVTGTLAYRRHFILLAGVTTVLGMTDRWRQDLGALATFGLYGAVHSTLIVATLRAPQTPWRKLSFIAIAAGLAMLCVDMGLFLGHRLGGALGAGAPALLLTFSSALGAASYGFLIRSYWSRELTLRSQVWITLCCGSATLAGLPAGFYLHVVGAWWFAMIWWWSLSIALALTQFRQSR